MDNKILKFLMWLMFISALLYGVYYLEELTPKPQGQPLVVTTIDYQIERWYDVDTEVVCYILNGRAISCLPVSDTTVMMPR